MNIQSITTFITTVTKRSRGGLQLDPMRDWLFVLAASLLLLTVSGIWNTFFFVSLVETEEYSETRSVVVREEANKIEEVRALFTQRAELLQALQSTSFVDPSGE